MLVGLRDALEDIEAQVVASVFRVDEALFDPKRTTIEEVNDFLLCVFQSAAGDRCRFDCHFGRRSNFGRFNFFIGSGAEWYNYESLNDDVERLEIAADVESFLRAFVRCERVFCGDSVAAEHYFLGEIGADGVRREMAADGFPIRFTATKYSVWPFSRTTREDIRYLPWLAK